jgi:hypothetical protein
MVQFSGVLGVDLETYCLFFWNATALRGVGFTLHGLCSFNPKHCTIKEGDVYAWIAICPADRI